MPANRMNRDEFYAAIATHDDESIRKILWTVYWRGTAQVRERIEDELRPHERPKARQKNELPNPSAVLAEVTSFVDLARSGSYMYGDRQVSRSERSKWRHTLRRIAADALAALRASDPASAQASVEKIVDLCVETKSWDYFHSDDPVEAAKFVVSDAVAALWKSILRHDGFPAFAIRVPGQLIRWEQQYGWTRSGYGPTAEKEAPLATTLAESLTTPDMYRTFAESYLDALDEACVADRTRPRMIFGTDEIGHHRSERAKDLALWHEMLIRQFAGSPEDELLDRLVASPALSGPELTFLRARIAQSRGNITQAAQLVTDCLEKLPGSQKYLDFAAEVGAELPRHAREIATERARVDRYLRTTQPEA